MRLAVLKERRPDETRVSATPETVKKYKGLGLDVAVEAGAGLSAGITDAAFAEAGAEIAPDAAAALDGAGIVLKVRAPMAAGEGGSDEMAHAAARSAAARPARHGGGAAPTPSAASTPARWSCCRASRARSPWTSSPRRRTSRATAR